MSSLWFSNKSLVLWLQLNENSGIHVHDDSGHGNNGMVYGASWVDGKYGKALSFNGLSDYVGIDDNDSLDIIGDITLSVWIYKDVLGAVQTILTKGDCNYKMEINSDGYFAFTIFDGGHQTVLSFVRPETNKWVFLAVTFSPSTDTVKFYVDGVLVRNVTDFTYNPSVNNGVLTIGQHQPYGQFWDGVIDEVRVYNRALSADEITALYRFNPLNLQLNQILRGMEKVNISRSIWHPRVWKPGMWEHDSPLQRALRELEK